MSDPTPRTATGRRMARNLRTLNLAPPEPDDWPEVDILAIEAEAGALREALDVERLARILHEVLPEDAAEHAPHGDRYCDYIADCIVDRYDDPDWPTPRLSTSELRREDEG